MKAGGDWRRTGFPMVQRRLAHQGCSTPDCGKTVLEAAFSAMAAPDREGMAVSDARQTNASVGIGRVRSRHGAEPAIEGPKSRVHVVLLMSRRITKPCAAPAESVSGILSSEEMPCAYLRQ
jgi:hypothetical protein